MSRPTLKIEGAAYILTMDPERRIIRNGSILVEGQRITRVGKASELAGVEADRVVDARDLVVTPGFLNGHMHVSYAHAVRGVFPDDLDPLEYLTTVFLLQSLMDEREEYDTSLLAVTELLRYGTTCFVDPGTTKFLDACLQVYEDSGARVITGVQVVDLPNRMNLQVTGTEEAIARTEDVIRRFDGRLDGRVRAWAMPFSADHVSRELLLAAKRLADEYGTGLTLHQGNRPQTVAAYLEKYGKRPVEVLEDLGVLGPNVLLAHCVGVDSAEVDAMARTGAKVALCPTAALKMGSGLTARGHILPEMLAKGVGVALGTDAGNNSNLLETLRAVYLTAVVYKDANRSTSALSAETALELATIEAARAFGLEKEIGSIEVGKKADLVLFDTLRPEWRALHNPVNSLVYNADGRSVHTVIVDGRVLVDAYRVTFVDERALIGRVQEQGERLLERAGISYPSRWPVV